ncbi:conjugative transposon protein TraM [Pontibacter litorisediminis]|uniref:conjugative transposon protein TraM n=1 Tax=Pontibacter litorisediminis TaxID=1846260 RepID=UPI0023EB1683|nr:conjugative transposon protein TraM [Pontibacter litorisediminis]
MRKIDFKKGRYVIPAIALPFLCILNYLYLDTFPANAKPTEAEAIAAQDTTSLNTSLPMANLDKRGVKDKFSAAREAHKYRTDYSAIRELGDGFTQEEEYGSVYTEEEQRLLDSLNNMILTDEPAPGFMERVNQRQTRSSYAAAPGLTQSRRVSTGHESGYAREMRMFKEQMAYIDSLSRAGEEPAGTPHKRAERVAESTKEPEPEPMPVRKTLNPNTAYFNTIGGNSDEQFIKAMLDEGLKVRDGGRIRIRLLDDIYVGGREVTEGSYLYGLVSGFGAQRVEITISSILMGDEIIPVNLSIYDNDGIKGLYVPDSQFRAFTKELAGRAASGQRMNFGGDAENSAEMLYAMMDRMTQTASQAAGRAIKKNKAKLKYNTVVYLIDNQAKQR